VVGSGMGGLALASHLAQAAQKVLLLDQNTIVGDMTQAYSRHGYRWTVGMHYIGDVGNPNGAGWKLFDQVTGGQLRWAPMPAIYNRMVIAGRGYNVPAGSQAYAEFLIGHTSRQRRPRSGPTWPWWAAWPNRPPRTLAPRPCHPRSAPR